MKLSSYAFQQDDFIPAKYTCHGEDINPPLRFSEVPDKAKSLALIVDDPDAPMGTWVHWLVWNINPKEKGLTENSVPKGAMQGLNSFGHIHYGGPCPPSGVHHYVFKLYALDTMLKLGPKTQKADLEKAMQGHILAQAEVVGLYGR